VNARREIVVAIGDEKSHHKIAFREVVAAAINAVLTRYPNTIEISKTRLVCCLRSFDKLSRSRSTPPPRGELERSIRSATSARWVMTMDVTLVAGPPEIYGGGGTAFNGLF
jgi:hypothetical protein